MCDFCLIWLETRYLFVMIWCNVSSEMWTWERGEYNVSRSCYEIILIGGSLKKSFSCFFYNYFVGPNWNGSKGNKKTSAVILVRVHRPKSWCWERYRFIKQHVFLSVLRLKWPTQYYSTSVYYVYWKNTLVCNMNVCQIYGVQIVILHTYQGSLPM